MTHPSHDPSIENEPHLRGDYQLDHSENIPNNSTDQFNDESTGVDQNVWDEPGIAPELTNDCTDRFTYADWLMASHHKTNWFDSWMIVFLIALAAGPWAILGSIGAGGKTILMILAVSVIGPCVEEIMKVAAAMWVVEKRPYWFKSRVQILFCAAMGGLAFAVIENLVYLNIYIPNPSSGIIQWRWTVCVALHVGCSCISGLGLMRVWSDTWQRMARPQIGLAANYLIIAAIVHGSYNAFAFFLDAVDFNF